MNTVKSISAESISFIKDFLDSNKTVFELIAVFIAIASFIVELNAENQDKSFVVGAICLIFLTGVLLFYLLCSSFNDIMRLLLGKSDDFKSTIQISFITIFLACFGVAYISICVYFFEQYRDLTNWVLIILAYFFVIYFGIWSVTSLYTYFTMNSRAILIFKAIFLILVFLILTSFIPITSYIRTYFTSLGQSEALFFLILSYFMFGAFHFIVRIPKT